VTKLPRSRAEALRKLWRTGNLWWLLDEDQQRVYREVRQWQAERRGLFGVLDCGRRWGKDTVSFVLAIEDAIRHPGSRIPYGAATQEAVKELLLPTAQWVLSSAPSDLRPEWVASRGAFEFPNGSRIVVAGLDMHPDRLRGPHMDTGFLSESAFVENLRYTVDSIFLPMMLGRPNAFLLLNSSAPVTSAHAFDTHFVPTAKSMGTYVFRTVEDSPRYTSRELDELAKAVGGRDSIAWRREAMGERITDPTRAIIPEWHAVKNDVVEVRQRPDYFDRYVALDPGFVDLTAALFAYVDFRAQLLYIEDELALSQAHTGTIARAIVAKETDLKFGELHSTERLTRVSDVEKRLVADLQLEHGIQFHLTRKDDRDAALADLRLAIQSKRIRIHPRCVTLRAHLEHGVWAKSRKTFDRGDEDGLSHFDAIAALLYLWRNVDLTRNPYPALDPGISSVTHHIRPNAHVTAEQRRIQNLWPTRANRGRR
jgi:hypothetical protein